MHTGELMRARALPVTATDPRASRVMHSGVQRCPPNNSECSKRSLKNTFKKRDKIRFYLPEKVYRKSVIILTTEKRWEMREGKV